VASEMAALTSGFAVRTGGQLIRLWAKDWMLNHELPQSNRGQHIKVKSLLEDPSICAEIRTYLCSHKWSTNLQKMAAFTKNELLPAKAEKYAKHIINKEMPQGLKKYLELEIFPRIQIKVGKDISMAMNTQMWFTIDKKYFYPLWLTIGPNLWSTSLSGMNLKSC
jgi:hypothetical protein